MTDSPACNLNQPASMITIITTNPARVDRAITTVHQFRLHVLLQGKGVTSLIL